MSFASRWVVLRKFDVGPDDFDADGFIHADVVEGWLADTRAAYLEQCVVVCETRDRSGLELHSHVMHAPARERLGRPTAVMIGAGATEIHPTAFTMAFRLRPVDGEGDAAINATYAVSLVDPATGDAIELGTDIRDELIALEHAAAHVI